MTQKRQQSNFRFWWLPVKKVLTSSAFGLFTLTVFSTQAVGQDYIRACQLPKPPRAPIYGQFGRLPDIPAVFDFSYLSTGVGGSAPGAGGGFDSMSGGGESSNYIPFNCGKPQEFSGFGNISDINSWIDPNLNDGTPPVITNISPPNNSLADYNVTFSAHIEDEQEIAVQL